MHTHTTEHNGTTYAIPEHVVQEAMKIKKELRTARSLAEICIDIAPEQLTVLPRPAAAPKKPLRDAILDFAFHQGISPQDLRTLESILKEYGHA